MEPYSPTVLEQGDSVHFDSLMRHGFVAVGDEDALMLSVSVFDKETIKGGSIETDGGAEDSEQE